MSATAIKPMLCSRRQRGAGVWVWHAIHTSNESGGVITQDRDPSNSPAGDVPTIVERSVRYPGVVLEFDLGKVQDDPAQIGLPRSTVYPAAP